MYQNYESRVKDFVLDMTNPNSMIEHKDITEKVLNTRAELINEYLAKHPEKKKPLVFRGYTSEADRIKDTIRNHKYLYYMPDYEKIKRERKKIKISKSPNKNQPMNLKPILSVDKNKKNRTSKILKTNYIINSPNININNKNTESLDNNYSIISQPTMRFKPRTDLERVFDILSTYHCDENPREIIERQLKSINLYDYKKPKESQQESDKTFTPKSFLSKSMKNKKKKKNVDLYKKFVIYYNPKVEGYKPWQRREDLNTEAYGLLNSYHYKTHFKAAEEIAESNYNKTTKNNNNNNNKNKSVFLLPNLIPNFYVSKNLKNEEDSEENQNLFRFGEDENGTEAYDNYEDEFEKNYNPIMKKTENLSDPEAMKVLRKLAFKQKRIGQDNYFKNEEDENEKKFKKFKKKKGNRNYTEDNSVVIKNKLYYKNTQFDQITSKILEMCNVYSPKSKFNNTVHKSKGGKTMITQGMTVREFEKKYGLQE